MSEFNPHRAALRAVGGAFLQLLALLATILPACCLSKAGQLGTLELYVQRKGGASTARAGKGFCALAEPRLTFEPVVGVALALTILIWKSNSRSARSLSHCPTANVSCAPSQLFSQGMDHTFSGHPLGPGSL